jgi:hypothetical protein
VEQRRYLTATGDLVQPARGHMMWLWTAASCFNVTVNDNSKVLIATTVRRLKTGDVITPRELLHIASFSNHGSLAFCFGIGLTNHEPNARGPFPCGCAKLRAGSVSHLGQACTSRVSDRVDTFERP